jgi:hypothetical protein
VIGASLARAPRDQVIDYLRNVTSPPATNREQFGNGVIRLA